MVNEILVRTLVLSRGLDVALVIGLLGFVVAVIGFKVIGALILCASGFYSGVRLAWELAHAELDTAIEKISKWVSVGFFILFAVASAVVAGAFLAE